jgi:hypothetical protein
VTHSQHVEECPDIGPICATQPQQPYQHDQHLYTWELDADIEVGLVPHLAAELTLGLRQVVERISYLDLEGNPYVPPVPDIHHRNETLTGPVDPWLMLHAGASWEGFIGTVRGGVTLPLGSTVPDPFQLGLEGLPHEHIQFGDGTFDPVAGLTLQRTFGPVTLNAFTLDRFPVARNHYGYQAGATLLFGAAAQSGLGLRLWNFSSGIDLFQQTTERWSGVQYTEGNLGRTDVLLDLSAAWSFAPSWSAVLGLKIPVYVHAVGAQVTYPAILSLGVVWGSGG